MLVQVLAATCSGLYAFARGKSRTVPYLLQWVLGDSMRVRPRAGRDEKMGEDAVLRWLRGPRDSEAQECQILTVDEAEARSI